MNNAAFLGEQVEILGHDETMALILKAQAGDDRAQELLVSHNLGLVRSVINY